MNRRIVVAVLAWAVLANLAAAHARNLSWNRDGSPPRPENSDAAHGSGIGSKTAAAPQAADVKKRVPPKADIAYRDKVDEVLRQLDLRPGLVVVDLGAGDGWWSERLAQRVGPSGMIHAAEVEQKLVDAMKQRFAGRANVKPYLCKPESVELAEQSCDLAFLSKVYHHLPKDGRVEYLRQLGKVVRPEGRLCVVEKYSEIATRNKDHGMQLSRVIEEAERAGWIAIRYELLTGTEHYLVLFDKKQAFPASEPEDKASK